jgi:hypothetical protein
MRDHAPCPAALITGLGEHVEGTPFPVPYIVDDRCRLLDRKWQSVRRRSIAHSKSEHMLHRCGSGVEAICADFDQRPYAEVRQKPVWIAGETQE